MLRAIRKQQLPLRHTLRWCSSDSSSTKTLSKERFGTKQTEMIKSTTDSDIVRTKLMPLRLVEEVPKPQKILTDLELLMMSWSEEHAQKYFFMITVARLAIFAGFGCMLMAYYYISTRRNNFIRGANNMPNELKVGCIVYLDIEMSGCDSERVVIGLLNEKCPLYCEAFHRRCTGNGVADGESFRGLKLSSLIPGSAAIFGTGKDMTHDVPGFDPHFLPTEDFSQGPFRGALSSIAYKSNQQSPNFAVHLSGGTVYPQVFGIVLAGYEIFEKMTKYGTSHQNTPKREFIITDCGELCTLDKSVVVPIPWRVYETVSRGYDEHRWGPKYQAAEEVLAQVMPATKAWWKFW